MPLQACSMDPHGAFQDDSSHVWKPAHRLHETELHAGRHRFSAFIKDCSSRTPDNFLPECRRLHDLFVGKELIGKPIKDCGTTTPYPDPRIYARERAKREEYIHDSQTDLWYHCCEYRPRYGHFSIEVDEPRTKPVRGLLGKAGTGIPENLEEPEGPKLQCNVLENLKHRQDDDGGRMVTDEISKSAFGSVTGLSEVDCRGDQAVALQRFAGGTKMRLLSDEAGVCVDTGAPGCATPMGKPYHVFRLSAPLPVLVGDTAGPRMSRKLRGRRRGLAARDAQRATGFL